MLAANAADMLVGARALRTAAACARAAPATVHLIRQAADDLQMLPMPEGSNTPRLVVTFPPYPGIHVLYHRWQVDGRKETPAPFWIANRLDGSGSSYYTMGDRKPGALPGYFDRLQAALARVVELCDNRTVFVQVVAGVYADRAYEGGRRRRRGGVQLVALPRRPRLQNPSDGLCWGMARRPPCSRFPVRHLHVRSRAGAWAHHRSGAGEDQPAGPDGMPEIVFSIGIKRSEMRRLIAEVSARRDDRLQEWEHIRGQRD
jgi:hypothetical protein